ncbi:hypothetical protein [Clavibacter nebraskensis]|nr:hypothetical protein [Clavibacter nebraskensis]QGV67980.1 hypothetical protein EGX36_01265 [Clavibacter nebraskensis]QGV70777.1 hypothetical protein EGX37_01255 [Clavibacter nebraskensis]QGV73569.1 hypothetical protein EGX35_01255 [Clavibacter nebraskensis]RIJ09124.1 hypothetical protein DZF97_10565 [Clavibacter nebraskensis]UQB06331.1 hypothetical protein LIV34_000251 [Clavibacter nebraskensis]
MDALSELIAALRLRGVTGRMQVFGGAALALCHFDRGTTVDIDARLRFDADVRESVALIAERRGWGSDWVNDDGAFFLPAYGRDVEWTEVFDADGLVIEIASAEALLAMKLHAGRPGRDGRDISRLMVLCGLSSVSELEDVHEAYYPDDGLSPRAERLVQRIIEVGLPGRPETPPPPSIG